jgi:hypothetical protein
MTRKGKKSTGGEGEVSSNNTTTITTTNEPNLISSTKNKILELFQSDTPMTLTDKIEIGVLIIVAILILVGIYKFIIIPLNEKVGIVTTLAIVILLPITIILIANYGLFSLFAAIGELIAAFLR